MNYLYKLPEDAEICVLNDMGLDGDMALHYLMHKFDVVDIKGALEVANNYNIGKYHPDMAIYLLYNGYELSCCLSESNQEIVSFVYDSSSDKFVAEEHVKMSEDSGMDSSNLF